jgi:hypothetical protein
MEINPAKGIKTMDKVSIAIGYHPQALIIPNISLEPVSGYPGKQSRGEKARACFEAERGRMQPALPLRSDANRPDNWRDYFRECG